MVKCIDCMALDIGLMEDIDTWVHCSVKHAMDMANLRLRPQPKISVEEAFVERECPYFIMKDEDKIDVFEIAEELGVG